MGEGPYITSLREGVQYMLAALIIIFIIINKHAKIKPVPASFGFDTLTRYGISGWLNKEMNK